MLHVLQRRGKFIPFCPTNYWNGKTSKTFHQCWRKKTWSNGAHKKKKKTLPVFKMLHHDRALVTDSTLIYPDARTSLPTASSARIRTYVRVCTHARTRSQGAAAHLSQRRIHSGVHKSGQQIKVVITFKPRKVKDCMAGSNGSPLNREQRSGQTAWAADMHLNEIWRSGADKGGANDSLMATRPQRIIAPIDLENYLLYCCYL